jgi:hypothetical protein
VELAERLVITRKVLVDLVEAPVLMETAVDLELVEATLVAVAEITLETLQVAVEVHTQTEPA